MKNQPLSYDSVCRSIIELQESGEKVTVRNLIAKAGGKTATITAYLRQWHSDSNNPDNKDISDDIKKAISHERNIAVNTAVIEYKKQIKQLDSMIQELSDKIVTQEMQIDTQTAEIKMINEQTVAKIAVLQAQIGVFDAQKLEFKEQIIEIRNNLDLAIKEKHESARQTAIWQTKYEQLHSEITKSTNPRDLNR